MTKFLRSVTVVLLVAILTLPAMALAAEHLISTDATQTRIKEIIAGDHRPDRQKLRDRFRHPLKTLSFFGIEPGMTVVEIWPGGQGGWYRGIIEPLMEGRGRYIPVRSRSAFPGKMDFAPYGEVDMVLVFRAHGFMIYDRPAQEYFDALFAMLRPGGIFGIVDHRGDEAVPQDPKGENGYVNESHVLKLASAAGFELLEKSDINANPKDDKKHPKGVWSLPPTLAGSRFDKEARDKFLAIGESDRFTLKFHKPEQN
ncbi:MAG: class I SAM-dependent methyltransferase [Sphingomonadales bacterium]